VSSKAFGNEGFGGQVSWTTPPTGLSFAYLTNGIDVHLARKALRVDELSGPNPLDGCVGGPYNLMTSLVIRTHRVQRWYFVAASLPSAQPCETTPAC
jgi:hypothetical protein